MVYVQIFFVMIGIFCCSVTKSDDSVNQSNIQLIEKKDVKEQLKNASTESVDEMQKTNDVVEQTIDVQDKDSDTTNVNDSTGAVLSEDEPVSEKNFKSILIPGLNKKLVLNPVGNVDGTTFFYGALAIEENAGPLYFKSIGAVFSFFEMKLGFRMEVKIFDQLMAVEIFKNKQTLEAKEEEKSEKDEQKTKKKETVITSSEKKSTEEKVKPCDANCQSLALLLKDDSKTITMESEKTDAMTNGLSKDDKEKSKVFEIKQIQFKGFFIDNNRNSSGLMLGTRLLQLDYVSFTLEKSQKMPVGVEVGFTLNGSKDEKMQVIASLSEQKSLDNIIDQKLATIYDEIKVEEFKKVTKPVSFVVGQFKIPSLKMGFFSSDIPDSFADVTLSDIKAEYIQQKGIDKSVVGSNTKGLFFDGTFDVSSFDTLFGTESSTFHAFYTSLYGFGFSIAFDTITIPHTPFTLKNVSLKLVKRELRKKTVFDDEEDNEKKETGREKEAGGSSQEQASGNISEKENEVAKTGISKLAYVGFIEGSLDLHTLSSLFPEKSKAVLSAIIEHKKISTISARTSKDISLGKGFVLKEMKLAYDMQQSKTVVSGIVTADVFKLLHLSKLNNKISFSIDNHGDVTFDEKLSLGQIKIPTDAFGIDSSITFSDIQLEIAKDKKGTTVDLKTDISLFGLKIPGSIDAFEQSGGVALVIVSDVLKTNKIPFLNFVNDLQFTISDKNIKNKSIEKGINFSGSIDFSKKPMSVIGKILGINGSMQINGKIDGPESYSIFIDLNKNTVELNPHKAPMLQFGTVKLKIVADVSKATMGAGGQLEIYLHMPKDGSVLKFQSELDFDLSELPFIEAKGTLQAENEGSGGVWKEPFGLKGLEVGPLGFYMGIAPETVPPFPKTLGMLGRVKLGNNVGDIQLMLDTNITNCGFKINIDASLGSLIQSAGTMVGVPMPSLPDIVKGSFYMSYGPPPFGLNFPGLDSVSSDANTLDTSSSEKSDKNKKVSKKSPKQQLLDMGLKSVNTVLDGSAPSSSTDISRSQKTPQTETEKAFPGLDMSPGHIPPGFYFNGYMDFLSLFSIDICMAASADVANIKKTGFYGGAKVSLSEKIQNLGIITLSRGKDPKFPDNSQDLVSQYKDLPCLKTIMDDPKNMSSFMFFAISPSLRLFLMSGHLGLRVPGLNFNVFSGDLFLEFIQDNKSNKVPEIDFYIDGKFLEVFEASLRINEHNGKIAFDAMLKNELMKKLAEWTHDLYEKLQEGLKIASKALDQADSHIKSAEKDVNSAFEKAKAKLDALKKAVAAIDGAQKVVGQFFGQAHDDITAALKKITAIIDTIDTKMSGLLNDLKHMDLVDMLEMKPMLWTIELIALEIAKDLITIMQETVRVSADLALDTLNLSAQVALSSAKLTVDAARIASEGVLDIAQFTAFVGMETARGIVKGSKFVIDDIAAPVLKIAEQAVEGIIKVLGGIFDIHLIRIVSADVKDLKFKVLIEMVVLGKTVKPHFDIDLTQPDKLVGQIFDEIFDAIKEAIVGAIKSIANVF